MSSLGGRNEHNVTFLSHCLTYRKDVGSVDSDPASSSIPEIRMDIDRQASFNVRTPSGDPTFSRNTHGHNGVLSLFVRVDASAQLQLWVYDQNDDVDAQGDNSGWFFVEETDSLTRDTMLTFRGLLARKYKVLVSANSGPVTILERHTE